MQGNDKVIKHLNKILSNELRAINQYFLHSRMLSDWGLDKFEYHGSLKFIVTKPPMNEAENVVIEKRIKDKILFFSI